MVSTSDDEEDDPDYKVDNECIVRNEHPQLSIQVNSSTTVYDLKKEVIEQVAQIGKRKIHPENLLLCVSSSGEIDATYDDSDKVESVDTSGYAQKIHFIEVRKESLKEKDSDNIKSTELNFSQFKRQKKG